MCVYIYIYINLHEAQFLNIVEKKINNQYIHTHMQQFNNGYYTKYPFHVPIINYGATEIHLLHLA